MKKAILAALFTGMFMMGAHAQVYAHDYQKSFGLPNGDAVVNYTLEKTSDGGYILAGMQEADPALGNNQNKIIVYKTDANYNILWEFKYELSLTTSGGNFKAKDIIERSNGGYAIAGSMIKEGAESGGFLMQLDDEAHLDWIQIYSDVPNIANAVPIKSIQKLAEKDEGYILIGSKVRSFDIDGIAIGVDNFGAITWANHLFDDQYQDINTGYINSNSILTDIVALPDDEFAIVGTANTFTIDDADILLVTIDGDDGQVNRQWIYERLNKQWGDLQPAYLDFGNAISYNEEENTVVIAGTSTVKPEGICTDADSKRLLTLKVDLDGGGILWSKEHIINVNLKLVSHFSVSDIIYDADADIYAICGSADNDIFNAPKTDDKNGYILRLRPNGIAYDLRYYGTTANDWFFSMEEGTSNGSYTMGGMTETNGKNHAWVVESFQTIQGTCNQTETTPYSYDYPMQPDDAMSGSVIVQIDNATCARGTIITENKVICAKQGVSTTPHPGDLSHRSMKVGTDGENSVIYPTIVTDMLTINNNGNHTSATVYSISGQVLINQMIITSGQNNINVKRALSSGSYQLVLQSPNGEKETFRFIVE